MKINFSAPRFSDFAEKVFCFMFCDFWVGGWKRFSGGSGNRIVLGVNSKLFQEDNKDVMII